MSRLLRTQKRLVGGFITGNRNWIKIRKDMRITGQKIVGMGLNSNAFLSPANDPMGSNGMHWRKLELSGNAKIGEFLKNGFRHFLWSGLFGGAILLGVSIYSQGIKNDRTDISRVGGDDTDKEDMLQLRDFLFSSVVGSFLFFGMSFLMPISTPILNQLVIRKFQVGPISHFIEYNFWRMLVTLTGCNYFYTTPDMFSNKYENVILSGGLGATFGSLLAGLVLARYNVPIATAGCTGILGGFMGYNSIKYYGEDEKDIMMEANRVFYTPIIRSQALIWAGAMVIIYLSGFFFPHALAATHGLLTGGFLAGIGVRLAEPYEPKIDAFVKNIISQIYPDLLDKE